jgi:ABC-type enterochelin transport system substrate-binding protein
MTFPQNYDPIMQKAIAENRCKITKSGKLTRYEVLVEKNPETLLIVYKNNETHEIKAASYDTFDKAKGTVKRQDLL